MDNVELKKRDFMNFFKRLKKVDNLIKRYFIDFIKKYVLRKQDLVIIRNSNIIVLEEMLKLHTNYLIGNNNDTAECVVFSMDRALQLHALLSTYFEKVKNPVPIYVIWRASSKEHKGAYDEVFDLFAKRNIYPIYQKYKSSFKDHLLSIIANMKAEKILFLVDDIIFINEVDMLDFLQLDAHKMVGSLRLGCNLTKAYTVNKDQSLPPFINNINCDNSKMMWVWEKGQYYWGYPLSLDGNMYLTKEIYILARNIDFNSPNTFESNLQKYVKYFAHRIGICYRESKILNIPANKVQNDFNNLHSHYHQDELLKAWKNGLQMDYNRFYGFRNQSAHQEVEIILKKRSNIAGDKI